MLVLFGSQQISLPDVIQRKHVEGLLEPFSSFISASEHVCVELRSSFNSSRIVDALKMQSKLHKSFVTGAA